MPCALMPLLFISNDRLQGPSATLELNTTQFTSNGQWVSRRRRHRRRLLQATLLVAAGQCSRCQTDSGKTSGSGSGMLLPPAERHGLLGPQIRT